MAFVPLDLLDGRLQSVKMELTVIPENYGNDSPLPIFLYDMSVEGYIGLPVDWGLTRFAHLHFEDRTSKGNGILFNASKKVDPNHELAPKGQAEFIDKMIEVCSGHYTCFAVADTGSGKTVSTLAVASHFNMRTLVVVPDIRLARQWREEIVNKLGIPKSRIALISGKDSEDFKASVCIGIINTMVGCEFSEKFYESFGTVILDEAHRYGSQHFSRVVHLFNSTITIGMTATDGRGDKAELCYRATLGPPRAVSKAESLPLDVYKIYYSGPPLYGDNAQVQINQLTKDQTRTRILSELIVRLYKSDRQILVASGRIEHLEEMMARCINLGVPADMCGLYTRQKTVNGKRVKVKDTYLDYISKHARIIFGIYKMCQTGIDIPRLDTAVEATPIATGVQFPGRVRRLFKNKKKPALFTIIDRRSGVFQGYARKRIKDYLSFNAGIYEGEPEWITTL